MDRDSDSQPGLGDSSDEALRPAAGMAGGPYLLIGLGLLMLLGLLGLSYALGIGGRIYPLHLFGGNESLAVTAPVCGAWQTITDGQIGPGQAGLLAVAARAPQDVWAVGFATGERRPAWVQHWDGSRWMVAALPAMTTTIAPVLAGVAAVAATDVWAVGRSVAASGSNEYRPLILHWNGAIWAAVPAPKDTLLNSALAGVAATGPRDAWAVGVGYMPNGREQTLTLHWDGTTWSVIPSPNLDPGSNSLRAVTALAPDDVWAVGYHKGGNAEQSTTLILHWDGKAWSIMSSKDAGAGDSLEAVAASGPRDVWAVGTATKPGEPARALIEHWDGTAWSLVPGPAPEAGISGTLVGVLARTATDAWAVGSAGPVGGSAQTLALHWDGRGWRPVPTANPLKDRHFSALAAPPGGDLWAVGGANDNPGGSYYALISRFTPGICGQ